MSLSEFNCLVFVKSDVHFVKKDTVFLVLSPNRKHIFELKGVNFFIWNNLQKPISFEKLLKKIKDEYDVDEIELTKDLVSWLKKALEEKIVIKIKT